MSLNTEYHTEIVSTYLKQGDKNNSTIIISHSIDAGTLGRYICALANYAALKKIPYAYAIWGIDQESKLILGSTFCPPNENELAVGLSAGAVFSITPLQIDGKKVVVLEVQSAVNTTMQYEGDEYIMINDSPERLSAHTDLEKQIWRNLDDQENFETRPAKSNIPVSEIINLLDCKKLFSMLSIPYPDSPTEVINKLLELRFIIEKNTGKYTINNLGALLLAKRLSKFETVEYKAVKVLKYDGLDITQPAKEQIGGKGYIVGFEGLIDYIVSNLPTHEYIDGALRKNLCDYPKLSVRELVANALIHQDLNESGSPVISIFPDHIEITNPGMPLIHFDRFIDSPPCSRNESLAAAMHKVGICEERGSGYDKVISYIEKYNLPAPQITEYDRSTKVCLFAKKNFESLSKKERVLACYDHVCLNYVRGEESNNTTLRLRFQLDENQRYKISRVFSDAIEAELIKAKEGSGMKNREYVPYWAQES
jgi:Predicted transcriptional regulator containing an HTH domain and an uncharacterized domain shared with the mammalian protein Schlafen